MKTKMLALALSVLFTMPCILRAEEIEIHLMEIIQMGTPLGDSPLDNPEQSEPIPPCRTCFRATINGNLLSITKQEASIPSARALVVNSSTGSVELNQEFTSSLQQPIATSGVHILRIETEGGALVGQFIVQ